jgi:DNA-directed RNA polymerase II subunit RPB2
LVELGIIVNQEDSIIVNQSAIDRGLFNADMYNVYSEEEKKSGTYDFEKICLPPIDKRRTDCNYAMLDINGVIKKGSYVEKGDVLIGKTFTHSTKEGEEEVTDCSLVVKKGEEGQIDRIFESITPNGYRLVKIVIRTKKILEVGDKCASTIAQKGTIGMTYRQEDMPFTVDGIVPDLIINAHCIPSRMTISQLLECVLGKRCAIKGKYGDSSPFTSSSIDIADKLCEELGKTGFERHGTEILYSGFTGEPLESRIFIGPTYYQRLKHLVSEKMHARARGSVTTLLRQPVSGRAQDGGLRFGSLVPKYYINIVLVYIW